MFICLLIVFFSVNCVFYVFLQYFDTVGWVFWLIKTVARITYTMLVETLNPAQSINRTDLSSDSCGFVCAYKIFEILPVEKFVVVERHLRLPR